MLDAGCRLKPSTPPRTTSPPPSPRPIPGARRVADERAILDDPAIRLVVGAGIPADRAAMALRAMRAGKDVMLDKPGCTTAAQLAELRRVQAETGRICSICYSEHYLQPATVAAARLVAEGAIGRVVQTIGLGPHRVGHNPARTGSGTPSAAAHPRRHRLAPVRAVPLLHRLDRRPNPLSRSKPTSTIPTRPGWNDYGHAAVASDHATGFIRVDWFTPTARRSGATAGCSCSAPRAPSSSASTSTSRAARAATTSSSPTARAPATSTAPGRRLAYGERCATTS